MPFQKYRLLKIPESADNGHPAAPTLTRLACLAFSLMLMYVFTVIFAREISDVVLRIIIVGFLGLSFLAWKYYYRAIARFLNSVRLLHILLLAIAIRLAWVLSSGVEQTTDFAAYDAYAWQIANGGKWFNFSQAPGAPIFFAIHYWMFGHTPLIPQISLAVLSTLQIYLVYDITSRTLANNNAGKMAALVMTFWPEHIIYNNLLCTEVPFTTLVLLAVWLLWPDTRGYLRRVFFVGICLGMANWVRPNATIILAAVLVFLFLREQGSIPVWIRCRTALIGLAGFALMVAPIVYINYRDLGCVSLLPNKKSGFNIMYGTNLVSHGHYYDPDNKLVETEAAHRGCLTASNYCNVYDQVAREIGVARLKEQPLKILFMSVTSKIPELWGNPAGLLWSFEKSRFKDHCYTVFHIALAYHVIIIGLSAWIIFRHRELFDALDERWIYIAAVLLATLSHVVLEVQPRYHHAFLPIFAMCIGAYARQLHMAESSTTEPYPHIRPLAIIPNNQQQVA